MKYWDSTLRSHDVNYIYICIHIYIYEPGREPTDARIHGSKSRGFNNFFTRPGWPGGDFTISDVMNWIPLELFSMTLVQF